MKKSVVIMLILFYGSSTIGAPVHLHYCMNELVGGSLWHDEKNDTCGRCGMKEKKGGCCKDEYQQIKLTTEHQKAAIAYFQLRFTAALLPSMADVGLEPTTVLPGLNVAHAPPQNLKKRLYLLYSAFLI